MIARWWLPSPTEERQQAPIRKGNGVENFAVLRHIALNLLRREKASKGSLKGRRKKAGWDNDYLLKVLAA